MLFGYRTAKKEEHDALLIRHARAQKRLVHPNILPVFSWSVDSGSGRPFAVTRLFEGVPLSELAGSKGLSFEQKMEIAVSIAGAMKYSHSEGQSHGSIGCASIFASPGLAMIDYFGFREASEKQDVYDLTRSIHALVTGTDFFPASKKESWWPKKLVPLFEKGLALSPESRPGMAGLEAQLRQAMDEYSAFLVDLSMLEVNMFKESPESLDLALRDIETGRTGRALELLKVSALYFRNESAVKMLADSMIDSGDLKSAYELASVSSGSSEAQKRILKAALMLNHPLKRKLFMKFDFGALCDAVAVMDYDNVRHIGKKVVSNDVAIAAAIRKAPYAAEMFRSLLANSKSEDSRSAIRNNLGAALAIQSDAEALAYLGQSGIEQSVLNSALFLFQTRQYKEAVESAEPARHLPKSGAVIKAVRKKLGIKLPVKPHPDFHMELLTDRLSERLAEKGVMPHDYEFARIT